MQEKAVGKYTNLHMYCVILSKHHKIYESSHFLCLLKAELQMRSKRLFLCNLQCFMHNVSFHKCLIIISLFSVTIVKKRQCTTVVGTPPTALLSASRNIGTKNISVCVDVSVRNRDPFLTFLLSASKKTGFRSSSLCDRVNSTVYLFY